MLFQERASKPRGCPYLDYTWRVGSAPLTTDIVSHFSRVVQHAELVSPDGLAALVVQHLVGDKVVVVSDGVDELLKEGGVGDVPRPQALLVQHGNDPLVTFFNEITDNLVVKVLHWLPL